MNILVLYTRFSAYVNASFSFYAETYQVDVHVVRYPVDKNSPFQLKKSERVFFYDRWDTNFADIVNIITRNNIKVVISSGWSDKLYMKIARWAFNRELLTICVADNQWMGTARQRFFTLISRIVLKGKFTKIWVPGVYQFEYARRLGFPRYDIMQRYYTADTQTFLPKKNISVPKRFIYVGRLLEIKGAAVLYEAVSRLIPELNRQGWQFLIIGSGPKQQEFQRLAAENACIEYHPFLQPESLVSKTAEGGVFVLPSNYDAWAVVVHEYALLGCPILLSEAVGSRSAFLVDGYNGWIFKSGCSVDLQRQCQVFMNCSGEDLNSMGRRSQTLASGYNLESWGAILQTTINEHFAGVKHTRLKRTKYE